MRREILGGFTALAVGALTLGGVGLVQAATDDPVVVAQCQQDDVARMSVCSVPYPDQATATVTEPGPTETVTETAPAPPPVTETVPGPTETVTETVTASPSPSPTPTTPVTSTRYGACITNGGTLASTITKWGPKVHVRQFISSGNSNPPTWTDVPNGTVVHRSYKPPTTITTAQIDALLTAAGNDRSLGDPKHKITFWHESDNDGLTGTALTARINLMNRLYDENVRLGRPVIVEHVVTGQFMADYRDESWKQPWRAVKADSIGVDFDGGGPSDATSFTDEIGETMDWLRDERTNGEYDEGWSVPEFGRGRDSGETGQSRVAWMQREVNKMVNASTPPDYVDWYDYLADVEPYPIEVGSPEYDYWKTLISAN